MRRRHRGVSLVEVCVALAIAAIALGMAVPSFEGTLVRRSVEGVAAQLLADLQFARTEAVARARALRVSFRTEGGASCYAVHTGEAGTCRCGFDGRTECDGPEHAIRTVSLASDSRVQVASNRPSLLFDPVHGTVSPTATMRVLGRDGSAVHHVVNILGRVRSCTPAGSMPGVRPC